MPRIGTILLWAVLLLPLMSYQSLLVARYISSEHLLGVFISGLPALMVMYSRRLGAAALGAGLFICPLFGSAIVGLTALWFVFVLLFSLGYYKAAIPKNAPLLWLGGASLCAVFLCGALVSCIKFIDQPVLAGVLSGSGLVSFMRYFVESSWTWERALGVFFGYVNALALMAACRPFLREDENRRAFEIGIGIGAAFCLLFLWGQVEQLHHFFRLNRSMFFEYAGRYSASLTDPNAFGLMAYLSLVYLLTRWQNPYRSTLQALAVLLAVGVLWSGSRTYWLGVSLSVVFCSWMVSSGRARRYLALAISAGVILLVLAGWPPLNKPLARMMPLPSASRVLHSINWDTAGEAVSSRVVYGRLGLAAWSSSPLTGIGVDRFIWTQKPVAEQLGIQLEDWRDNTNNYYLQVLAECGLCGFIALVLGFACFAGALLRSGQHRGPALLHQSLAERIEKAAPRALLWSLAVVLITGPHFAFDEVRYFAALLFAAEIRDRQDGKAGVIAYAVGFVLIGCLLCSILLSDRYGTRGLYDVEQGGVRWAAKKAQFQVCPAEGGRLRIRALRPGVGYQPLTVSFSFASSGLTNDVLSSATLKRNGWHPIKLPMSAEEKKLQSIDVAMEVDSLWSPSRSDWSADVRGLGVQIDWDGLSCKTPAEVEPAPWAIRLLSASPTSAKEGTTHESKE